MTGDTGVMVLIVVWVVVALLVSAGVLVLAARLTSEQAPATFVTDLRAGLRSSRSARRTPGARGTGILASARRDLAENADVDNCSVDDIFSVGRPAERDYLDTEQLSAGLARTIGRVAHSR